MPENTLSREARSRIWHSHTDKSIIQKGTRIPTSTTTLLTILTILSTERQQNLHQQIKLEQDTYVWCTYISWTISHKNQNWSKEIMSLVATGIDLEGSFPKGRQADKGSQWHKMSLLGKIKKVKRKKEFTTWRQTIRIQIQTKSSRKKWRAWDELGGWDEQLYL